MAFEELFMMEPLTLAPGIQVPSATKAIDSSKNEAVAIHVEDARPKPSNIELDEKQEPAWLQLNSDIPQEDPALKEIHPALRDEPQTTTNGGNQFLPQQEIKSQRETDEVSQTSSTTGYHDVSEGTIQDRASIRTDPTDTFASALESRASQDIDTDSINVDPPEIPLRTLTMGEISKHNKLHDMWLVVNEEVYDVTQFQHRHPGGPKILYGVAGKDATKKFDKYHRRALLETYKPIFRIGVVGQTEAATPPKKGLFKKMGIGKKKA